MHLKVGWLLQITQGFKDSSVVCILRIDQGKKSFCQLNNVFEVVCNNNNNAKAKLVVLYKM